MALGKTVFFKKLAEGTVRLYINDIEGVLPSRWFIMDTRTPRIGVPVNYALTIFSDNSLQAMLNKNYIEVENMAALVKEAEEKGYIAPSEEEVKQLTAPKRSNEALFAILKGGNSTKIQDLFESADKHRALEVAKSRTKDLSLDVISTIESILGMAITEE